MTHGNTSLSVIGITGPSGAGKSILCDALRQRNVPCIDADGVYHGMLVPPSPCLDALRVAFGDGIFRSDGSLDRAALGAIVFHDAGRLALLNQTVLPRVLDEIRAEIRRLQAGGATVVCVDAPTLIESGFHKECDLVISVLAHPSVRAKRIAERDGLSAERAEERIRAQKPDDFYMESSHIVLSNDGEKAAFLAEATRRLSPVLPHLFTE